MVASSGAAAVSIRSDFEGGSIGTVRQLAPGHFSCAVKGEVNQDKRNRQASWYYFQVDGSAGRELTLDLVEIMGEYNYVPGSYPITAGVRPFISYDRRTWTPLPTSALEWDAAASTFRMRFVPSASPVWIAHVPPYITGDLNKLLDEFRGNPHLSMRDAGKTVEGRKIHWLTVTNQSRPDSGKKVLWLMARQHAWESGTSWVAEGALRFLLKKDDPVAARLRDEFVVHFFPMADPDGVTRGGVRFNLHGFDVNRNWDVVDPARMPEIAGMRKAVLDWVDSGRRIDLFVTLHNTNNDYIAGPVTAGGPEYRRIIDHIATTLAKETIFEGKAPRDWLPGKIAPGRMDVCQGLFHDRAIPTMLLEQSVRTNTKLNGPPSPEDYRRLGGQLVVTMASAVTNTKSGNLLKNPGFTGGNETPDGWTLWASRDDLRPRSRVIQAKDGNLLELAASRREAFGKWESVATGLQPGRTYQFEVWYRPEGIKQAQVSVPIILTWCKDDNGKSMVQRDFVDRVWSYGAWRRAARTLEAPAGVKSVRVELGLRWTEKGSVVWKSPRLEEVEALPHRKVRVATTHLVPAPNATVASNLALMSRALDEAGARKPDIVLLSENFVDRGVRLPLLQTAQTVPGPATQMLSRKARQYSTYVATSLHEREGDVIYNTAVLIDRLGRIAGKYRKTHLAMIEGENGVSPGNDYPVFATDFGTVGMLVCWDNWFSEPARLLRLKGAELLLLPIAGDGDARHWDIISRARALDNGVYLVSSNTVGTSPSRVIDPLGEVLAETAEPFGVAFAEIDLDRQRRQHWLSVGPADGEAKSLYIQERRPDTYGPLTGNLP